MEGKYFLMRIDWCWTVISIHADASDDVDDSVKLPANAVKAAIAEYTGYEDDEDTSD